jgi:hypothetical protein
MPYHQTDLERPLLLSLSPQFTPLVPISSDLKDAPGGYALVCKSELSSDNWLHAARIPDPAVGWEGFLNGHHYSDNPQPLTAKEAALKLQQGQLLCLPLFPDDYLPPDVDKQNKRGRMVVISKEINDQLNVAGGKVMTQINFRWIAENEGGQIFRGYVPFDGHSVSGWSGMTIATGFDMGQTDEGAGGEVGTLLKKFHSRFWMWLGFGMHGFSKAKLAETIRSTGPVPTITAAEANEIDQAVMSAHRTEFLQQWERLRGQLAVTNVRLLAFEDLSESWQTVLVDLFFNGIYLFHPSKFRNKGQTDKDFPLIGVLQKADAAAAKMFLKTMLDTHPRKTAGFNIRRERRWDLIKNDSTGFVASPPCSFPSPPPMGGLMS